MAVFNFPYHTFETEYPETGQKISFGGGYEFAVAPRAPDQVVYKLNFAGMFYFLNTTGTALSTTKSPLINMMVMENFYKSHRLHVMFDYEHPVHGLAKVRFRKPLAVKQKPGGLGAVEPFTVELLTQP